MSLQQIIFFFFFYEKYEDAKDILKGNIFLSYIFWNISLNVAAHKLLNIFFFFFALHSFYYNYNNSALFWDLKLLTLTFCVGWCYLIKTLLWNFGFVDQNKQNNDKLPLQLYKQFPVSPLKMLTT